MFSLCENVRRDKCWVREAKRLPYTKMQHSYSVGEGSPLPSCRGENTREAKRLPYNSGGRWRFCVSFVQGEAVREAKRLPYEGRKRHENL